MVEIEEIQRHLSTGDFAQAEALLPDFALIPEQDALRFYLLGMAVSNQGRLEDAVMAFRKVTEIEPSRASGHCSLARVLRSLRQFPDSIDCYRRACEIEPDRLDVWVEFIRFLDEAGQRSDAFQVCHRLLEDNPKYGLGYYVLGELSRLSEQYEDAIKNFKLALKFSPELVEPHQGLGECFGARGDRDQARKHFEAVIALVPDHMDALGGLASLFEREGELDEAYKLVRRVVDSGSIHDTIANVFLHICNKFDACEEAMQYTRQVLKKCDAEGILTAKQLLHFSLGQCLDKLSKYDEAFHEYEIANAITSARYDPSAHTDATTRIIDIFTPAFMMSAPRATNRSDRPVFIVGMPRSGTSLVEQVLASHPEVSAAGELEDISDILTDLPRYSALGAGYPDCVPALAAPQLDSIAAPYHDHLLDISSDARRVTDKMPHNFLALGLIALLFPGARIIHCRRDPLDTCLSIYFQNFMRLHDYAASLEGVGTHYRQYQRLMRHWKNVIGIPMFELNYEDMVDDQESITRQLLKFCDLEWDPVCLNFHQSGRVVHTASYAQVNKPIYRQSMKRWKNYDQHLDRLRAALEQDFLNG